MYLFASKNMKIIIMSIIVIANTQLKIRNTSVEQVHLKIFVSSVEFCKFKFDNRKGNRNNRTGT